MRRRIPLALAWLPCVLCAALWARSFWRCDVVSCRDWTAMSELGGLYWTNDVAFDGFEVVSVEAGVNGRLEEETGTTRLGSFPHLGKPVGHASRRRPALGADARLGHPAAVADATLASTTLARPLPRLRLRPPRDPGAVPGVRYNTTV